MKSLVIHIRQTRYPVPVFVLPLLLLLSACASGGISYQDQAVIEDEIGSLGGPGAKYTTRFLPNHAFEATIDRTEDPRSVLSVVSFVMKTQGSISEQTMDGNDFLVRGYVGSGYLNMNPAALSIWIRATQNGGSNLLVRGVAKEGLLNQKTSEKAVTRIASGIVRYLDSKPKVNNPPTPEQSSKGTGTGFFVSERGLILTAQHVVKNASKILVYPQKGQPVSAIIEQADPANDIAILSVRMNPPAFLFLSPPRAATSGQRVFTMGFPVPNVLGREPKYTEGVISSLSGLEGASSLLQITVPIQPGNSGGPLLNERGEVVGIITSTAAVQYFLKVTGSLPQNVNWAIKSEYARPLFDPPVSTDSPQNRDKLLEVVKNSVCLIEVEY